MTFREIASERAPVSHAFAPSRLRVNPLSSSAPPRLRVNKFSFSRGDAETRSSVVRFAASRLRANNSSGSFANGIVDARVEEFRDQVKRRLAGQITEDQFKPLRLMNGLYLQLHAYMLRVAVPYGTLDGRQMR
eukprot:gene1846-2496_t